MFTFSPLVKKLQLPDITIMHCNSVGQLTEQELRARPHETACPPAAPGTRAGQPGTRFKAGWSQGTPRDRGPSADLCESPDTEGRRTTSRPV